MEWLLLRLFHIEIRCHQVYGVWQVQDIVVTAFVDLLLTDLVAGQLVLHSTRAWV